MSAPEVVSDSLARHKAWLHIEDCLCPFGWVSQGRLYGVNMGMGWSRLRTEQGCRHHDLCSKKIAGPINPSRPTWKLSPWCHRLRGHGGPCSEGYDAAHGKGSQPCNVEGTLRTRKGYETVACDRPTGHEGDHTAWHDGAVSMWPSKKGSSSLTTPARTPSPERASS